MYLYGLHFYLFIVAHNIPSQIRVQQTPKQQRKTPKRALTVAFQFTLNVVSSVQLPPVLVLFQLGPKAVRSRGTFWFWRVVGRGHAGAVRCAGGQRFTVAQNVFD